MPYSTHYNNSGNYNLFYESILMLVGKFHIPLVPGYFLWFSVFALLQFLIISQVGRDFVAKSGNLIYLVITHVTTHLKQQVFLKKLEQLDKIEIAEVKYRYKTQTVIRDY